MTQIILRKGLRTYSQLGDVVRHGELALQKIYEVCDELSLDNWYKTDIGSAIAQDSLGQDPFFTIGLYRDVSLVLRNSTVYRNKKKQIPQNIHDQRALIDLVRIVEDRANTVRGDNKQLLANPFLESYKTTLNTLTGITSLSYPFETKFVERLGTLIDLALAYERNLRKTISNKTKDDIRETFERATMYLYYQREANPGDAIDKIWAEYEALFQKNVKGPLEELRRTLTYKRINGYLMSASLDGDKLTVSLRHPDRAEIIKGVIPATKLDALYLQRFADENDPLHIDDIQTDRHERR